MQLKALVIRQGLRPVAIGIAGGMIGAAWITHILRTTPVFSSQLFEVTPHDPTTFVGVAVGLAAIAFLACWVPATRMDRIDPASVLRSE